MKRLFFPLIAALGFFVGWSLPKDEPAPAVTSLPISGEGPRHELKKRALIESLLFEEERDGYRRRSASIAEVLLMMKEHRHLSPGSEERIEDNIARLMELGPAAAMDAMFANPITDPSHLKALAIAWERKQPDQAARYLRGRKKSYLVEDCLDAVLRAQTEPEDEAAITSPEVWAKEEPEEQADESPAEIPLPPGPTPPGESPTLDPANFNAEGFEHSYALSQAFAANPDETIAKAAAMGNRAFRQAVMEQIMDGFPRDPKEWPEASRKLESAIHQLGMLPLSLPPNLEFGPDLPGSEVASWADRQPLALRRAWAPYLVDRWAQVDPQAAVAWANALPENASRNQTIQTGLIVWTHRDPSAAIAYVDALPAGDLREVAISNAAATWKCIDPAAAKKWVEALPDSPGKQRALARLK